MGVTVAGCFLRRHRRTRLVDDDKSAPVAHRLNVLYCSAGEIISRCRCRLSPKAFTPLSYVKGREVGLGAHRREKKCINQSKWLAYAISLWRFVSALPWSYYWFTVNLEVIGKALLMLPYLFRTAALFFLGGWRPSSFMSLQYLWISFLSLYSEA